MIEVILCEGHRERSRKLRCSCGRFRCRDRGSGWGGLDASLLANTGLIDGLDKIYLNG